MAQTAYQMKDKVFVNVLDGLVVEIVLDKIEKCGVQNKFWGDWKINPEESLKKGFAIASKFLSYILNVRKYSL